MIFAKTPKNNKISTNYLTYFKNNIPHQAQAVDIDEKGGLVVLENGEKITLTSGEITVRFPLK